MPASTSPRPPARAFEREPEHLEVRHGQRRPAPLRRRRARARRRRRRTRARGSRCGRRASRARRPARAGRAAGAPVAASRTRPRWRRGSRAGRRRARWPCARRPRGLRGAVEAEGLLARREHRVGVVEPPRGPAQPLVRLRRLAAAIACRRGPGGRPAPLGQLGAAELELGRAAVSVAVVTDYLAQPRRCRRLGGRVVLHRAVVAAGRDLEPRCGVAQQVRPASRPSACTCTATRSPRTSCGWPSRRASAGSSSTTRRTSSSSDGCCPRGGRQRVLLRIRPGVDADTHAAILTGHAESKFGLDPREARALAVNPPKPISTSRDFTSTSAPSWPIRRPPGRDRRPRRARRAARRQPRRRLRRRVHRR